VYTLVPSVIGIRLAHLEGNNVRNSVQGLRWGEKAIKYDAGNTRANGVAVEERTASKRVMRSD